MTTTQQRMLRAAFIIPVLAIAASAAMAQTAVMPAPAKGSKVYLTSGNAKAARLAKYELEKDGYWTVTDNKDEANVLMDLRVKRIWWNDRKAYAVITDAQTNASYETRPVNTLMRFTFRPTNGVVKKLMRKRVERYQEQAGNAA